MTRPRTTKTTQAPIGVRGDRDPHPPAHIHNSSSSFQRFVRSETSGGVLLLLATVAALIFANSPWSEAYARLWETGVSIRVGEYGISESLLHWINDGLMAVFFCLIGLEIKRELLVGRLSSLRRAALPIAGALGGVALPAGVYLAINWGGDGAPGWGIPMATDPAFALGLMALLAGTVPSSLRVFLAALAIVDDVVAVFVIGLFYSSGISWNALGVGAIFLLLLGAANRAGVRNLLVYGALGVGLWASFLGSGVHTTIAGVLLALAIPARTRINTDEFIQRSEPVLDFLRRTGGEGRNALTMGEHQDAVMELEDLAEGVQAPLQRIEHALVPVVAFFVVPVFALANAGIGLGAVLGGDAAAALTQPVTLGVALGLIVGKQLGITLASWLAVRIGLAALPEGVNWWHIYGASWLGGIGFTTSLFIASLAFGNSQLLSEAKLGILVGSIIAGTVGCLILRRRKSHE